MAGGSDIFFKFFHVITSQVMGNWSSSSFDNLSEFLWSQIRSSTDFGLFLFLDSGQTGFCGTHPLIHMKCQKTKQSRIKKRFRCKISSCGFGFCHVLNKLSETFFCEEGATKNLFYSFEWKCEFQDAHLRPAYFPLPDQTNSFTLCKDCESSFDVQFWTQLTAKQWVNVCLCNDPFHLSSKMPSSRLHRFFCVHARIFR